MASNELLYAQSNLQALLAYGQQYYQWTMLDLPSMAEYPGIGELAAQAGPVVMVARSRKTRLEVFRRASVELGSPLELCVAERYRLLKRGYSFNLASELTLPHRRMK